jgi:membrane protein required for colicin V production
MTSADWIFTGIVVVSLLLGLWRGLVFEVLSLVGWVVSFFMAQWLAVSVSVQLPLQGLSDPVRYAVGFALIFLVCVVAAGLLASLSRKIISVAGLLPIDRLMGAAFGALRGLVILLAVAVVIDLTPLKSSDWWQQSKLAPLLSVVLVGLKPALPGSLSRFLV